jgi:KaiC/GvpD/RAD55 family RecA-like ATPase
MIAEQHSAATAAVPLSPPLGERDSGTGDRPLHIDTLAGLAAADLPKREFVLWPILPARSLAMVYAQRGVGKTHAALGIAYAVASGGTFLRWRADQPRNVMLIDGEMPAELLKERALSMMAGADKPLANPDAFRLVSMDRQELGECLNLASPTHQARIDAILDGVDLLILDNISTLVSGGRENDAESWDTMQPWLLQLRRRGVSVLLVAHAGRSENARGTSKREDVLDTVIQLRRPDDYDPEEGARFEVRLTKARGVFGEDAAPFVAKLEVRDGADIWSAATLTDLNFETVLELSKSGKSIRDIEGELGISRSRVQRIQTKLKEEGRL